jgi:hypothetical protein
MVDSAAMAIDDNSDWCWIDAEVGGVGREVGSESDSEIYSGSKRLYRAS